MKTNQIQDRESNENNEKMVETYRVIKEEAFGEIVEKRSRFLAYLCPVETEEEALEFIEGIRKKHYDARHNCFAYILGRNRETERCSDDGEPSGTAGRPMLDVLKKEGLTNVVAVVTRYFGGTLLGTGGLVRAYTQSLQDGLLHAQMVTMRLGIYYEINVPYTLVGKIQYICGELGIEIFDTTYTDTALFRVIVPADKEGMMKSKVVEQTAAVAEISRVDYRYFVDKDTLV